MSSSWGHCSVRVHAYQSKPYPGRVLLFKAKTEPLYHLLEVDTRWAKVAQELEVIPVRGTHGTIVELPYVRAQSPRRLQVVLATFHRVIVQPAEAEEVLV